MNSFRGLAVIVDEITEVPGAAEDNDGVPRIEYVGFEENWLEQNLEFEYSFCTIGGIAEVDVWTKVFGTDDDNCAVPRKIYDGGEVK